MGFLRLSAEGWLVGFDRGQPGLLTLSGGVLNSHILKS